jgi:hypothetical protein
MTRKPTKQKTRKAPAATPASPEPPDNGEEHLTDLEHLDELNRMVQRMHGLEAAILGVCDSDTPFDNGIYRLTIDIADAMKVCAEAFEAERQRRKTASRMSDSDDELNLATPNQG